MSPGFFGNPVLPTYTGPTAQEAIEDMQRGQQQGFNQRVQRLDLAKQGLFLDPRDADQFSPMPTIPQGTGDNIKMPDLNIPDPNTGAGLMRTRTGSSAATPATSPDAAYATGTGGQMPADRRLFSGMGPRVTLSTPADAVNSAVNPATSAMTRRPI